MSKQFRDIASQQAATLQIMQQRLTCEGCAHLVTHLRPRCTDEHSPHYRQPRDTYHDRCARYWVKGQQAKPSEPPPPAPEIPPAKPHARGRLVTIDGKRRVVTEEQYRQMQIRYRRRVRA